MCKLIMKSFTKGSVIDLKKNLCRSRGEKRWEAILFFTDSYCFLEWILLYIEWFINFRTLFFIKLKNLWSIIQTKLCLSTFNNYLKEVFIWIIFIINCCEMTAKENPLFNVIHWHLFSDSRKNTASSHHFISKQYIMLCGNYPFTQKKSFLWWKK